MSPSVASWRRQQRAELILKREAMTQAERKNAAWSGSTAQATGWDMAEATSTGHSRPRDEGLSLSGSDTIAAASRRFVLSRTMCRWT
jgi:hypothetical protein